MTSTTSPRCKLSLCCKSALNILSLACALLFVFPRVETKAESLHIVGSGCEAKDTNVELFMGDSLLRQVYAYSASEALGLGNEWQETEQESYQVGGFSHAGHPAFMESTEVVEGFRIPGNLAAKQICAGTDVRYYRAPGCKVIAYIGILKPFCKIFMQQISVIKQLGQVRVVYLNTNKGSSGLRFD